MSNSSAVQPVVSTEAIGKPRLKHSEENHSHLNPGWGSTARQIRASILTSLPLLLTDVISLVVCFLVGTVGAGAVGDWGIPSNLHLQILALSGIYTFTAFRLGLFPASGVSPIVELRHQVIASGTAHLLLLTINGVFGRVTPNETVAVCIAFPVSAAFMPAIRYATRYVCAKAEWWGQPIIILGAGQPGRAIFKFFQNAPTRGLRPIGVVDKDPDRYWTEEDADSDAPPPFLGTLEDIAPLSAAHGIAHGVIVASDRTDEETQEFLAMSSGIPQVTVLSNRLFLPSLWVQSCDMAGLAGVRIQDRLLSPRSRLIKRCFDLAVSSLLLLFALPVFLSAAVALKWSSPGPIFYGHSRIGRNGKRFKVWKIRTMIPDANEAFEHIMATDDEAREEWNRTHKLKNDPRVVSGIPRFLRQTSLDELPQLWNVLVGEMSLVGPRPLPDDEIERYDNLALFKRVRPGVTGLWQISGRNNTTYEDKIRLDTYYIRNWSPWMDYYIVLRTVRTVVLREGSY